MPVYVVVGFLVLHSSHQKSTIAATTSSSLGLVASAAAKMALESLRYAALDAAIVGSAAQTPWLEILCCCFGCY